MRRTDEDFKAEVFCRCEIYRAKRRRKQKMVLTICLPVLLCSAAVMMFLSNGFGRSAEKMAADTAVSMECMDAPAAMEQPEAAPEEGSISGNTSVSRDEAMPEDFAIRFVWAIDGENIYDTYAGIIQKDLVLDGFAEAEFTVEEDVLEEIYLKILELDITSIKREMTSEVLTTTGEVLMCLPLETYQIQFTMNDQTYLIKGDYTADSYHEDEEAVHFMTFVRFMREIAWDTPEYQALPDANGGYD